jgi:hypothetical protein
MFAPSPSITITITLYSGGNMSKSSMASLEALQRIGQHINRAINVKGHDIPHFVTGHELSPT